MRNFCDEHNLLLIVDGSQSVGILDIDVEEIGIDILCFSGHKCLFGPQGTGAIYVRKGLMIPAMKQGGSGFDSFCKQHPEEMPTRLEAGTLNAHGIAGLGAGVSYVLEQSVEQIYGLESTLMWQFYDGIKDLKGLQIFGDFSGVKRIPMVSFMIEGEDSAWVADELYDRYGIATRAGVHCAPLLHTRFSTQNSGLVRVSFSCFNTAMEVEKTIQGIKGLLEG